MIYISGSQRLVVGDPQNTIIHNLATHIGTLQFSKNQIFETFKKAVFTRSQWKKRSRECVGQGQGSVCHAGGSVCETHTHECMAHTHEACPTHTPKTFFDIKRVES